MGREAAESVSLAQSSNRAPTSLAPGFRFHPTDEELVIYYLKRKVCGKAFRFNAISEVDIYKSEPWDLADKSSLKSRDQEYYFFSALDKKYGNGARMNRATSQGYWKATGNDRPVLHHSKTVGMKKTLVFHSGRAPDGKRTNWVMHEYRLIEEELEKAGVGATQKDGFVLCRVFHKNNIGPPSGQRYAPFIEEEWDDDDKSGIVPGIVTGNVVVTDREACCGGNDRDHHVNGNNNGSCIERNAPDTHVKLNIVQQEMQFVDKISHNALDHPKDKQKFLSVCKIERTDDLPPQCVINQEERLDDYPSPEADDNQTLQLFRYKRKRLNDSDSNNSNASENSSRTTQDLPSSTTTAATTTETATTKAPPTRSFLSALVEYSLLESIEPRDTTPAFPPEFDPASLGSTVPPACLKYIQDLQHEIHKVSLERETLKFEMMSAQSMINILQSRIELLNKENYDLRRSIEDSSG